MNEKELKIGKHIILTLTKHYKSWNQWILGVTLNKEVNYLSSNSLYEDIALKRNKYEFNTWLVFIGLHVTIYGKTTKHNNNY